MEDRGGVLELAALAKCLAHWIVTGLPLALLAIPSVAAGWFVGPVVFGDYFGTAITQPKPEEWHGLWGYTLHGMMAVPFWLALAASGNPASARSMVIALSMNSPRPGSVQCILGH